MQELAPISSPTEAEFNLIARIAVRIDSAVVSLITRSDSPPDLVRIIVDDFRGLELFTLSLGLIPGIRTSQERQLAAKRRRCTLRDVWCYGGDGVGSYIFGQEQFREDAVFLHEAINHWCAVGIGEVEQVYRLWSIALTSAISIKAKTSLVGLPWIIESGVDDFAPKACAIALNPNGEAQDYLKEVWGVA